MINLYKQKQYLIQTPSEIILFNVFASLVRLQPDNALSVGIAQRVRYQRHGEILPQSAQHPARVSVECRIAKRVDQNAKSRLKFVVHYVLVNFTFYCKKYSMYFFEKLYAY